MNRAALEMHKKEKHGRESGGRKKEEKSKAPRMGGEELNRVNIRLTSERKYLAMFRE